MRLFRWALALVLLAGSAMAADRVARLAGPGTLVLENGAQVVLAGIDTPAPPPWQDKPDDRHGRAARALLDGLAVGRLVMLDPPEPPRDRYGRLLAQVTREDGVWLQGEMLKAGAALVRTRPEARARVAAMLAVEAEARAAGRGLWADAAQRIQPAERARPDGFRIVEGRVADAARVRGTVYLNFGPDRRTDFTATLDRPAVAAFRAAGIDPLTWKDRRLRLRGWVRLYDGPLMELDHPEQVEVLE